MFGIVFGKENVKIEIFIKSCIYGLVGFIGF